MSRKSKKLTAYQTNKQLIDNLLTTKKMYVSAAEIAKECHISKSAAYALVRKMRLEGYPIQPGISGYVHSKFASLKDDVHFMRRIVGTTTSNRIIVSACSVHILPRWKGAEILKISETIAPFISSNSQLGKSKAALDKLLEKY